MASKGPADMPAYAIFQLGGERKRLQLNRSSCQSLIVAAVPGRRRAMEFFKAAALAGNPDANYNLGVMYKKGDGVTKDSKMAMKF